MMERIRLLALVFVVVACAAGLARGQVSPFTGVRFEEDSTVLVRFEGDWVELVSIGGVSTGDLVAGAQGAFGSRWQKRIGEDLLDVFEAMGVTLDRRDAVDLAFRRGDVVVAVKGAPMTREHRTDVWVFNKAMAPVASRVTLEQLAGVIESRHAYATMRGEDVSGLIEAELETLGEVVPAVEVRRAAQRIVCRLGDGHAGVRDWRDELPGGYLPVVFERAGGGIVALRADRSGLVDDGHPYIESIDGVALERWLEGVRAYVPAGSAPYVESRSLRELRGLNFARMTLGREASDAATLVLRDESGTSSVEVELGLEEERASNVARVERESGCVDGDIGYLRLARMVPDEGVSRDEWIGSLRRELESVTAGAKGLVIDVRGNGGGWRDPILALMPCLMSAGDDPVVVNTARYRLGEGDDPHAPGGYLENRFLYPRAWSGWTDTERGAIDRFRAGFDPAWEVPEDGFSDWHYMVVPAGGGDVVRFEGAVVVLMDAGCFSATDIFLAAMGELPQVTLMGTASGGGSARSKAYEIGELVVKLASMASYQPNGRLFDGVGVRPDVIVEPGVRDLVGRGDRQLERAIELIRGFEAGSP